MNKEDIIYREIKKEDYPKIIEILNDTWFIKDYPNNPDIAYKVSEIFLYQNLCKHSFSNIAVYNNDVCGVILARSDKSYSFIKNIKYLFKFISKCISLGTLKEGKKILKEEQLPSKAQKRMLNKIGKTSGELVLFVLKDNIKGMGIGRKLLDSVYEYMNEEGVKNFYVLTDSNCDYSFYDHNGFTEAEKETITRMDKNETYFVYTKEMK